MLSILHVVPIYLHISDYIRIIVPSLDYYTCMA